MAKTINPDKLAAEEEKALDKLSLCAPLIGESDREFRLRACREIIGEEDGLTLDDIVAKFNSRYSSVYQIRHRLTFQTSKESIARTVKILKLRGEADCEKGEDGRRREWFLIE